MRALLMLSLFAVCSVYAAPQAPRADHPILGIWQIQVPGSTCVETYRFRSDGTSMVTSNHEVSENEYQIRAQPDDKGFYAWDDRIVKNNGKEDCGGEIMPVGDVVHKFLKFAPSGNLFLMCFEETMGSCIGPFRRVVGTGI
jgi:hypothetical protein